MLAHTVDSRDEREDEYWECDRQRGSHAGPCIAKQAQRGHIEREPHAGAMLPVHDV